MGAKGRQAQASACLHPSPPARLPQVSAIPRAALVPHRVPVWEPASSVQKGAQEVCSQTQCHSTHVCLSSSCPCVCQGHSSTCLCTYSGLSAVPLAICLCKRVSICVLRARLPASVCPSPCLTHT